MSPHRAVAPLALVLGLGVNMAAACSSETEDPGFEDLSGSGGSTGSTGQTTGQTSGQTTGTGMGGATTSSTTGPTSSSVATTGTGQGCIDNGPGEPDNDTLADALSLGDVEDPDQDGGTVQGIVSPGDEDWFTYHGLDEIGSVVDPTRTFSSSEVLTLCKYVDCDNGDPDFDCPNGTSNATSPTGDLPGCCSDTGFTIDLSCGGSFDNEDANIYMQVQNPNDAECASYTIVYHY